MTKRAFDPLPVTIDDDDARLDDYAKRSGIPEIKRPIAIATQAPEVPLHVTVPHYVLRKLKMRAAEESVSVRYLVLKALNDAGAVDISEGDLIGDRRAKLRAHRD
jgi:hypothetical protein